MEHKGRDHGLDALLDLDGQVFVVDSAGKHWVKFRVTKVPVSQERPHGLDYSMTLHDESGERLVGFDNAHPVGAGKGPGRKMKRSRDHRRRFKSVKPYEYKSAVKLLEDFWSEVEIVLKERGVKT
jgi:hypothetical protein